MLDKKERKVSKFLKKTKQIMDDSSIPLLDIRILRNKYKWLEVNIKSMMIPNSINKHLNLKYDGNECAIYVFPKIDFPNGSKSIIKTILTEKPTHIDDITNYERRIDLLSWYDLKLTHELNEKIEDDLVLIDLPTLFHSTKMSKLYLESLIHEKQRDFMYENDNTIRYKKQYFFALLCLPTDTQNGNSDGIIVESYDNYYWVESYC